MFACRFNVNWVSGISDSKNAYLVAQEKKKPRHDALQTEEPVPTVSRSPRRSILAVDEKGRASTSGLQLS